MVMMGFSSSGGGIRWWFCRGEGRVVWRFWGCLTGFDQGQRLTLANNIKGALGLWSGLVFHLGPKKNREWVGLGNGLDLGLF